jgi:ABC-type multidrug transport system, ATPase component
MLAGILVPSQGQISVDGSDARAESLSIKQRLGYVPETGGVYESLTGLEFLEFTARLYHLKESLILSRSRELLRLFDLADVMNRRLSSYSKGMKQKVLICSALIHNPDLICLDKPLSGLEVNAAMVLKSLLRTLAQQDRDGLPRLLIGCASTNYQNGRLMRIVESASTCGTSRRSLSSSPTSSGNQRGTCLRNFRCSISIYLRTHGRIFLKTQN